MRFVCDRYPSLKVWDGAKIVAEFADGAFETGETVVIELLKRIPEVRAIEKATGEKKGK